MDKQYQQQYETISNSIRIHSLLSLSLANQSNVQVTLPKSTKVYSSTICQLDSAGKYFLLNNLGDYLADSRLSNHKILNIVIDVHGAEISFTGKLLKVYQSDSEKRFAIEMPNSIKYRQRRSAHRVHVSLAMDVKASMVDNEGETYVGQLRDISAGGMKVQFTRLKADKLSAEAVLPNCTIQLPDTSDIHCSFKIRHLQENHRKNGFTIGGNFVALEQDDKRTIERFIAILERRSLRGIGV